MADLFIKARQSWFPSDREKAKGVYKKYDIVHICQDDNNGKGYGLKERWPNFVIIRIRRSVESLQHLVASQDDGERRRFYIDFDSALSKEELGRVKDPSVEFIPTVRLSDIRSK